MIKKLPTKEADEMREDKRETIKDLLTDQEYSHKEFGKRYEDWNIDQNHAQAKVAEIDEQIDFLQDPESFARAYHGRMSPFVKERIYRDYHSGISIKNLSLKYGIL